MRLRVSGVTVVLDSTRALEDVVLEAEPGEVLGILGPNGAGKTTLLRVIAGMLRPSVGTVLVGDEAVHEMPRWRRAEAIAYAPPGIAGAPGVTVADLVLMAFYPGSRGLLGEPRGAAEAAEEVLARLGLEGLAERSLDKLSSGELKRALLAHVAARRAKVILVDEPTAFLDLRYRVEAMRLLRSLAEEGRIVIAATHDLLVAPRMLDKALLLDKGRVVAAGRVEEVLTAENIERVFGVKVAILDHPLHGRVIVPL